MGTAVAIILGVLAIVAGCGIGFFLWWLTDGRHQ